MKIISVFLFILILAASCSSDRLPATETENMYDSDSIYDQVDSVNKIESDSIPQ